MDKLTGNQSTTRPNHAPGAVRVLAQAMQVFDDRPPRNRMEFAVARKLADQMRRIMRQPASVQQVFRLSAEFPAVEALLDDFLLSIRIVRNRERDCAILDQLMRRLANC